MLKVIGFDLDGTLTQHRTPLPEASRELLRDTFFYAKETRDRFTLLQLVYDLGLTELLSAQVIERVFES